VTTAPVPWWRLSVSSTSTWLDLTAHGLDANAGVTQEGSTPRHQFGVRSRVDLAANVELDAFFRHLTAVRQLRGFAGVDPVPAYSELDVRLAWRATNGLELALVGQNLLHDHHAEFGRPEMRGEVERGVYASVTWRR
jgi:iron complex outermembrane receptor protein